MVFENIPVKPETKKLVDAESKNKEIYDETIKRFLTDRAECLCGSLDLDSVLADVRKRFPGVRVEVISEKENGKEKVKG